MRASSSKSALAAGALVCAAAALTMAGCSSASPGITAHGLVTVEESCDQGTADYPDIGPGAQVTVTDPSHKVVTTSILGSQHSRQLVKGAGDFGAVCSYPFTVKVPAGLARYGITVSHRGTIYYSPAQMAKGPWLTMAAPSSF
jgi:hypothetical protein